MQRRGMIPAVLLAAVGLAAWTSRSAPVVWEYREVQLSATVESTPTLNRLGAEGWELVNVVSACASNLNGCQYWAYFKRQK